MDLQGLLKKTEERSAKIKNTRPAASVAIEDRPYTNDLTPPPSPAADVRPLTSVPSPTEKIDSDQAPSRAEYTLKTEHKADTEPVQTGHKEVTKQDTNRTQSGHKKVVPSKASKETEHKADTQADTSADTKRTQSAHKADTNSGFSSLVGLQREVAIFVYRACQYARAQVTDPLTLEHVSTSLKIRIGSVKTTLRRLEEKTILERVEFRTGRGGWSKYRLPEAIFREMLQLETGHKLNTNRAQTAHKADTQPDTQPDTSPSSSSSFLDLENSKTTTTGEPELFDDGRVQLSPDWSAVDTSPLAEIGFTQNHLMQLAKYSKLSAAEVESSIEFFAFDLKRNAKAKALNGSPLNFFMGILRKGVPYAPSENYESPADEARRRTREIMERKQHERQTEELRIFELAFSEWRRGLAPNDLIRLVPEWAQKPGQIQDSALKSHFETNIWPERAQEVFGLPKFDRAEIGKQIDQAIGEVSG